MGNDLQIIFLIISKIHRQLKKLNYPNARIPVEKWAKAFNKQFSGNSERQQVYEKSVQHH